MDVSLILQVWLSVYTYQKLPEVTYPKVQKVSGMTFVHSFFKQVFWLKYNTFFI